MSVRDTTNDIIHRLDHGEVPRSALTLIYSVAHGKLLNAWDPEGPSLPMPTAITHPSVVTQNENTDPQTDIMIAAISTIKSENRRVSTEIMWGPFLGERPSMDWRVC